jgi:hypothetical protein
MRTIRSCDALFITLMVTVVLASSRAEDDPSDDFVKRYEAIAAEARSVWNKAQLRQPTISEKRLRLEIEISNLSERVYLLAQEIQTFRAGHLQAQLDSKTRIKSKPYERLILLANRAQLLEAWLSLLSVYFETGRPVCLQAATPTYNSWEMLDRPR